MSKLFGGLKMSWPVVILFAVVTGVYTGLVGSAKWLDDTSYRDIAVMVEWWVVFAVVIATNCKKPLECMFKIFIFFVISQPLVYLVEVALHATDPSMAWLYYRTIWGPRTLLTLPGGLLAFYIKKENPFGGIVMGMTLAAQMLMGVAYTLMMLSNPPRHALSAIFCFASGIVMLVCIQRKPRERIIAVATAAVIAAGIAAFFLLSGRTLVS